MIKESACHCRRYGFDFWLGKIPGERKKVKLLSRVQFFATPWTVCSLPGSSIHGIFQARVLEWGAISFSRGIFPTQGLNLGLLHCRHMLCHLSHQGRPWRRKWQLTPVFLLGNPMDRESWWVTVHGVTERWTRLSD